MTKREKEIIRRARDVFMDTRKILGDAGAPLERALPAIVAADVLDWVLGEFPDFGDRVMVTALMNQEMCKRLQPERGEEIKILPGWASPPVLDRSANTRQLPRVDDRHTIADKRFLRACGIEPGALNK
jgi:hypothetical protein